MQVALENNIVFVVIEYLAILCWGLSGGLAAIRKGYDIFTIMLCCLLYTSPSPRDRG